MQFKGNFTQQEPIPPEAIEAATEVMQHGRLHRYNTAEGEVSVVASAMDASAQIFRRCRLG